MTNVASVVRKIRTTQDIEILVTACQSCLGSVPEKSPVKKKAHQAKTEQILQSLFYILVHLAADPIKNQEIARSPG
jgi:hypothetical protein